MTCRSFRIHFDSIPNDLQPMRRPSGTRLHSCHFRAAQEIALVNYLPISQAIALFKQAKVAKFESLSFNQIRTNSYRKYPKLLEVHWHGQNYSPFPPFGMDVHIGSPILDKTTSIFDTHQLLNLSLKVVWCFVFGENGSAKIPKEGNGKTFWKCQYTYVSLTYLCWE